MNVWKQYVSRILGDAIFVIADTVHSRDCSNSPCDYDLKCNHLYCKR